MYTTVIFDLDETLLDRSATLRRFVQEQYRKYEPQLGHIQPDVWEERFVALDKRGYEERDVIYNKLIEEFRIQQATSEELVDDFMTRIHEHCVPMEGMMETLRFLQESGIRVGIITNGGDAVQKRKIDRMNIRSFAEVILTSGGEQIEKPEAEIFLRGIRQLGVSAEECLFVGDHPINDVQGAREVGMSTVWITRGFEWTQSEFLPDYTIERLDEIIGILKRNS